MIFGRRTREQSPAVYSAQDLEKLKRSGWVAAQILHELVRLVRPGVTTLELNDIAFSRLKGEKVEPAFLGYDDFPAVLCASVNAVAVHGVPNTVPLQDGDILTLDFGVIADGFYSDTAVTIPVGNPSVDARRLIQVTEDALKIGISRAVPGGTTGDIGAAVQQYVEEAGFEVIRELTGHGVGRTLHEAPQIPNFGEPGEGTKLVAGMVIAIEPITAFSTQHVKLAKDGFSYLTDNGSLAAHTEHTVAITENGPIVLTAYEGNH
jgi:methionyl aminopeptidase